MEDWKHYDSAVTCSESWQTLLNDPRVSLRGPPELNDQYPNSQCRNAELVQSEELVPFSWFKACWRQLFYHIYTHTHKCTQTHTHTISSVWPFLFVIFNWFPLIFNQFSSLKCKIMPNFWQNRRWLSFTPVMYNQLWVVALLSARSGLCVWRLFVWVSVK